MGPDDVDCLPCRPGQCESKCVHFEFEGKCVPECPGPELYANTTSGTCLRCHEECAGGCFGPVSNEKSIIWLYLYEFEKKYHFCSVNFQAWPRL